MLAHRPGMTKKGLVSAFESGASSTLRAPDLSLGFAEYWISRPVRNCAQGG
jgi:hypothetical protein